jgi:hypothetical protein
MDRSDGSSRSLGFATVDLKVTAFAPALAALAQVSCEQEPVHARLRTSA